MIHLTTCACFMCVTKDGATCPKPRCCLVERHNGPCMGLVQLVVLFGQEARKRIMQRVTGRKT